MDFLGSELLPEERDASALFHVLPVPLEKTVSYGAGTAGGPAAILAASQELERICPGPDGYEEPCKLGIKTHAAMDCEPEIAEVMRKLRHRTRVIAHAGHIPVTLGGEHSLTFGAAMGVMDALQRPIGLVQIDAHADLRVDYQGERHSHASVMNLLAREGVTIAQYGVRALCRDELEARETHGVIAEDGFVLSQAGASPQALPESFPREVYVSFDVDGLDPSVMPATGTPVPGGLGFEQALGIVAAAVTGRRVVGIDVVELAPSKALAHCDFTAAQLVYRLMAIAAR